MYLVFIPVSGGGCRPERQRHDDRLDFSAHRLPLLHLRGGSGAGFELINGQWFTQSQ